MEWGFARNTDKGKTDLYRLEEDIPDTDKAGWDRLDKDMVDTDIFGMEMLGWDRPDSIHFYLFLGWYFECRPHWQ